MYPFSLQNGKMYLAESEAFDQRSYSEPDYKSSTEDNANNEITVRPSLDTLRHIPSYHMIEMPLIIASFQDLAPEWSARDVTPVEPMK
ncbi:hypothetical protein Q9189_001630 [Teloschistes chrysophthalmus]